MKKQYIEPVFHIMIMDNDIIATSVVATINGSTTIQRAPTRETIWD
ncbi:MAG: hypothetical protein IKO26_05890 [Paludibacteraceae bacterium]|nr:hypothetical protein [Paludibacteraceae bacterium]